MKFVNLAPRRISNYSGDVRNAAIDYQKMKNEECCGERH